MQRTYVRRLLQRLSKLTRHRLCVFSSQKLLSRTIWSQVPWHVCILDEVHIAKNFNAQVTQAAMQLRTCFR
jgi:SNF2 family DNA or RNA helicase